MPDPGITQSRSTTRSPVIRPRPDIPASPVIRAPGYPAEPGYSGSYLPAPYVDALDQPGQYVTSSYQPGQYEADQYEAGQYEAEPYEAGQYEAAAVPDRPVRSPAVPARPGEPVRGGPDRYGEAP